MNPKQRKGLRQTLKGLQAHTEIMQTAIKSLEEQIDNLEMTE